MRAVGGLALLALLTLAAGARAPRHGFYRDMEGAGRRAAGGARRLFGGRGAALEEWGAACALLDRYWGARCSAAVLAPRWALTAAHCVSPHLAYVKYNSRRPAAPDGDVQPVLHLYRHPGYRVVQEDEGRGMDVTLLHHDVGLVRTRGDMRLAHPPALPPLRTMALYDPMDIRDEEVQVLGFGRTERSALGEELTAARLRLVACERGAWFHCACGVAAGGAGGAAAGVCAGDSGGPVLYRGAQVAVTSMGPLECAAGARAGGEPAGTSVLTALARYAALVNATMQSADEALRMSRVSRAPPRAPPHPAPRALLASSPLLLLLLA